MSFLIIGGDFILNSLLNAVADNIAICFPDIPIYADEVVQGLERPCFFIRISSLKNQGALSDYIKSIVSFEIQYFPFGNEKNMQMDRVAASLSDALEIVEVQGVRLRANALEYAKSGSVFVSGLNSRYESADSILSFNAQYSYFSRLEDNSSGKGGLMENSEINLRV